jgi:hypothetical protein
LHGNIQIDLAIENHRMTSLELNSGAILGEKYLPAKVDSRILGA